MDTSTADRILVDSTNVSKPSEQSEQRRRRLSELDSFAKLSESKITTITNSTEELDDVDVSTKSESTITRLILSPALFVSYLISLYVVDKRERTVIVSKDGAHCREKHTKQIFVTPRSHRKRIKSELAHAFEIRGKILTVIIIVSFLLIAIISWVLNKFYISRYVSESSDD